MRSKAIICVVIIALLSYLQWGREVEVCNSRIETSGEYRSENITVIANTLYISNKEEFAKQMVQKSIDNSFKEIKCSYDLGYSNELTIDIYLNEIAWENGNRNFRINYIQERIIDNRYNIRENPEKFRMEIE